MVSVSVLLCAYNAEAYIKEAVESVLTQSFRNFELLLVDDGSTDNTLKIMSSFRDGRIKILKGNHDYIRSLNLGMRHCSAPLVARMDADDRMMPFRLERQVELMNRFPDLVLCGSWAKAFGGSEGVIGNFMEGWVEHPLEYFLLGIYLVHPTVMIRKNFLRKHRLSYKEYPYAEDMKLWTDIARFGGRIYVHPEPLLEYRITTDQVTFLHRKEQDMTKLLIQQEVIEWILKRIKTTQVSDIRSAYRKMMRLNEAGLLTGDTVVRVMFETLQGVILKMRQIS